MPNALECEIGALLAQGKEPRAIARALRERWETDTLSADDQRVAAQFLTCIGFKAELLLIFHELIAKSRAPVWPVLAETLRAVKVTPTKAEAAAIAKGCDEQGQMADLLLSPFAVSWGELFASRRAELNSRKALELEEKRAQLWDAVRFMRSSRLYEQEAKSLAELRALFPDDPEFASQDQSLQERWAREIIAQGRGARLEFTRDDAMRAQPLSAEQDAARREIARQAIEWARVHPQLAVDFALLLHFMEFRDDAIDALDAGSPRAEHQPDFQAERSPSRDWLRLELLLTARQFVRALDAANRLEIVYAHDPEAAFAVAYARAHALWGLGEKGMAVDLMRAIVRVRPGYRSAQSLLLDWSGGADA